MYVFSMLITLCPSRAIITSHVLVMVSELAQYKL